MRFECIGIDKISEGFFVISRENKNSFATLSLYSVYVLINTVIVFCFIKQRLILVHWKQCKIYMFMDENSMQFLGIIREF